MAGDGISVCEERRTLATVERNIMHWGFWSVLWWTATLLVGTILYRRWSIRFGHGLKAELATLTGMSLFLAYALWVTVMLGV